MIVLFPWNWFEFSIKSRNSNQQWVESSESYPVHIRSYIIKYSPLNHHIPSFVKISFIFWTWFYTNYHEIYKNDFVEIHINGRSWTDIKSPLMNLYYSEISLELIKMNSFDHNPGPSSMNQLEEYEIYCSKEAVNLNILPKLIFLIQGFQFLSRKVFEWSYHVLDLLRKCSFGVKNFLQMYTKSANNIKCTKTAIWYVVTVFLPQIAMPMCAFWRWQ